MAAQRGHRAVLELLLSRGAAAGLMGEIIDAAVDGAEYNAGIIVLVILLAHVIFLRLTVSWGIWMYDLLTAKTMNPVEK